MPRQKKIKETQETRLTLDQIVQDNEKFKQLIKVTFDDGRYTEIYAHFKPVKIDEMLEDFSNFMVAYEKEMGSFKGKEVMDYLNLHILIHFSTLVDRLPENIEEKIHILDQILNHELSEKVFESFNKEEVSKVFDRMMKRLEVVQDMTKQNEHVKKQLRDYIKNSNLENKEIIEQMMFGESDGNIQ